MFEQLENILLDAVNIAEGQGNNDQMQKIASDWACKEYDKLDAWLKFPNEVDWLVKLLIPLGVKLAVGHLKAKGLIEKTNK